jgi:hypothetical protein
MKIKQPEIMILNAPNCKGDKPIKLFLIRINELPQIRDNIAK